MDHPQQTARIARNIEQTQSPLALIEEKPNLGAPNPNIKAEGAVREASHPRRRVPPVKNRK
jgi:hypothetical protein